MRRFFFDPQPKEFSQSGAEAQSHQGDGLQSSPGPGHFAKDSINGPTEKPEPGMMSEAPAGNRELSFGEKAVGLSFNPGGNPVVNDIKQRFAHTIDYLNHQRELSTNGEVKRMLSIAITEAQTSQMWAVKAVTWNS